MLIRRTRNSNLVKCMKTNNHAVDDAQRTVADGSEATQDIFASPADGSAAQTDDRTACNDLAAQMDYGLPSIRLVGKTNTLVDADGGRLLLRRALKDFLFTFTVFQEFIN